MSSHADTGSPTRRGKFVREVLLCQAVPSAPPDVNTMFPVDAPGAASARRAPEAGAAPHGTGSCCAACHQVMDPVGLGLENFDGVGAYRTMEVGLPIDASGNLDGVAYTDARGPGAALKNHPDIGSCLTRDVLRYMMQRAHRDDGRRSRSSTRSRRSSRRTATSSARCSSASSRARASATRGCRSENVHQEANDLARARGRRRRRRRPAAARGDVQLRPGTAYAQGTAIPKRLGVFLAFWGNGVRLDHWTPANLGTAWTPSPSLAPLMAVKDYVNVVSGMSVQTGNERGHHAGAVGILSGAPMISEPHPNSAYASTFSAPSIDQVAAGVIGKTTRFRTLEVGVSQRLDSVEGTTLHYLSHNGPDSANPPEYSPTAVFNRLFGADFVAPGATPVMPAMNVASVLKKSVLDAVLGDLTSLKMKVGTADGARLDQHLDNIRSIENRLATTADPVAAQAMCSKPATPTALPAEMGSHEAIAERMTAMSSLIAMALACDRRAVVLDHVHGQRERHGLFWRVQATSGHHTPTTRRSPHPPTSSITFHSSHDLKA